MTAEEAISGFQELSRRFNQGYKWGELEEIWPELLQCSHQAFTRTVFLLSKNHKQRPEPKYILRKVKWWNMNLEPLVDHDKEREALGRDPDAEGREAMALMKARFAGEIDVKDYAAKLFSMSERYGKPGYAVQAKELLGSVKN